MIVKTVSNLDLLFIIMHFNKKIKVMGKIFIEKVYYWIDYKILLFFSSVKYTLISIKWQNKKYYLNRY